jgi:hypothetical protein
LNEPLEQQLAQEADSLRNTINLQIAFLSKESQEGGVDWINRFRIRLNGITNPPNHADRDLCAFIETQIGLLTAASREQGKDLIQDYRVKVLRETAELYKELREAKK